MRLAITAFFAGLVPPPMWDVLVVLLVALAASMLTLFSGFGLGTLLLPAFALVFPLEVAVAATAVVHLANNVVKGFLLYKEAFWPVVGRFGIPALLAAFAGAWVLGRLPSTALWSHAWGTVTVIGLTLGTMIFLFGLLDLVPGLKDWSVASKHLPLGGVLSGFFGGLSGHQGALRSVFLTKLGLDAATFVATATFCAILVDVARLMVYGIGGLPVESWPLLTAACLCAFLGAFVGKKLLGKTSIGAVRTIVGVLLLAVGAALAAGLV